MIKKIFIVCILSVLVFSFSGCGEKSEKSTKNKTYSIEGVAGVYVYEKYEGDLPYNITYQTYTLNADGTFNEKFEWVSQSYTQKTTSDVDGTWRIEGSKVIITYDSKSEAEFDLDGERLIQTVPLGFNTGNTAKVYHKKE